MYLRGLKGAVRLRGLGQDDFSIDPNTGDVTLTPSSGSQVIVPSDTYAVAPYGAPAPIPLPPGNPSSSGTPVASSQFPTSNQDWTGLLKTAITGYGQVVSAQGQVDVAKLRAQYPYGTYAGATVNPATGLPYSTSLLPGTPGYLPFPGLSNTGTLFGIPTTYVLIGAAIAAFFIAKG